MDLIIRELGKLGIGVLINEPMKRRTTMRVGGPADVVALPGTAAQIIGAINLAKRHNTPYMVIGNGSNIIFRDGGYRGLVIILGDDFSSVSADGDTITAEAGAKLSKLSSLAMSRSLSGLEFAHGIPGSTGGGVAMNAGAYGGELKDVLASVQALGPNGMNTLTVDEMNMGYRTSRALTQGLIILMATFRLREGDPDEISRKMADFDGKRRQKQPLNFPSSGSVFKRPEGYFAGALIEKAGLKGFRVGDAMVSDKHAGFIVNIADAKAADVIELIGIVQRRVFEHSGVTLEREVRIAGED